MVDNIFEDEDLFIDLPVPGVSTNEMGVSEINLPPTREGAREDLEGNLGGGAVIDYLSEAITNYPQVFDVVDPMGVGIFRTPEDREASSISLSPMYGKGADLAKNVSDFVKRVDETPSSKLMPGIALPYVIGKYVIGPDFYKILGKAEMGQDLEPMEGLEFWLVVADGIGIATGLAKGAFNAITKALISKGVPEKTAVTQTTNLLTKEPDIVNRINELDDDQIAILAQDRSTKFSSGQPTTTKTTGTLTAKDEMLGLGDDLNAPKQIQDAPTLKQEPSPVKLDEIEAPVTIDDILETTRKDLAGKEAFEGKKPSDIIGKAEEPKDPFLTPNEPISAPKQEKQTVAKDPVVLDLKNKIPEFTNLSDAEKQLVAQRFAQSMLNPAKRKELVKSLSASELAEVERYALEKGLITKESLDIAKTTASAGSISTKREVKKNTIERLNEIDVDTLSLDGPDPIIKIINEERKAAGLVEFSPKTSMSETIKRVIADGDIDPQTLNKIEDYRKKRKSYASSQNKARFEFFDEEATKKADAALDVINKINKDRETPAKFTREAFVQELKKEYPDLFKDSYSAKTSRQGLINRLKEIHPEISDSLLVTGQKSKKGGTFEISEGLKTQQNVFGNLFSSTFKSGQDPITLLRVDPETRFFDNLRRTSKQSAEDFFETVKLSDIEEGGKYYNDFRRFKEIDKIRLDAVKDLRPLLKKIFSKVTDKPEKSVKAGLQIAHRFEAKGVKEGFASDKYMKGGDPSELYIDVSEYNSVIQPALEQRARVFYKKYLDEGLEEDYQELLEIHNDMIALGVEGQIAPGFKIGEAMPINNKIRQIMDDALDEKIITEEEYFEGYRMAEKIGEAKEKYKQTFGPAKFSTGGVVEQRPAGSGLTEDLDIFQDDLPEGSYEVASLKLPFFKLMGKAPVNEVAPIPTPKSNLTNQTKKQKESLDREKEIRSQEDIFDPTPNETVEIGIDNPIELTPITQQPMTSVFYADIERAMTNAPDQFTNKQEVLDFLNKNRIKQSEQNDYRIPSLLKLFDDNTPISKQEIISQVRSAPISGMRVHATGPGSEIINPNGEKSTRYTGYYEQGSIPDTQRERVLYLNKDKLPGDSGQYPQSMFGGEQIQRHDFGIPNEQDTYIIGWTRLSDRYGFVPPKVEGPQTKINVNNLTKEKTKNERSLQGLYAEARSKIERLANQRGMNQAEIFDILADFGSDIPKLSVIAKYADQLDEISPGLVNQMDELIVKNNELQEQITKGSGVDPSGVVRVTFADEIQSDLLQAAAGRKQQLAAALRKVQEEGDSTNLEGLNKLAQSTMDFFEKNKSVFRPIAKTKAEVNALSQRVTKIDQEVDELVDKYIQTREVSDADLSRLSTLLNENLDDMMKQIIEVDASAMDGLFPDLPFKNRDEWADALIKKDLYELAYKKFILKDPDASSYYAVSPSKYVIERYKFKGNASTSAADRARDKQRRFEIFKRDGEFRDSQYKGIGMDEFYGGPNAKSSPVYKVIDKEKPIKEPVRDADGNIVKDDDGKNKFKTVGYQTVKDFKANADMGEAENFARESNRGMGSKYEVIKEEPHYTSTIETILKRQAQGNNSEMIIMPVQLKGGRGATQYRVTDQNGNMVATLTNEDQARQLLLSNPNYRIQPIAIPNKKNMEPVFAIKITPEMLEPYKTHKAQGGLVEHIDIFEV